MACDPRRRQLAGVVQQRLAGAAREGAGGNGWPEVAEGFVEGSSDHGAGRTAGGEQQASTRDFSEPQPRQVWHERAGFTLRFLRRRRRALSEGDVRMANLNLGAIGQIARAVPPTWRRPSASTATSSGCGACSLPASWRSSIAAACG